MDDQQIIDLYWERSETAISETDRKYGKYRHYIAYSILRDRADCDECVNDTYFRAWEAMPPHRPGHLAAFLGRITRNLSLDRRRYQDTEKRRMDRVAVSLEELQECVPSVGSPEDVIEEMPEVTLEEAAASVRGQLEGDWETITESLPDTEYPRISFSVYAGNEWNSAVEDHIFYDNGRQGTYHITSRYFMEATEGAGSRFWAMINTFTVVDSQDAASLDGTSETQAMQEEMD